MLDSMLSLCYSGRRAFQQMREQKEYIALRAPNIFEQVRNMDKENNTKKQQETSPSPSFRVWLCGPFRVERLVGCAGLAPVYEVVRSADWSGSTLPRLLLKLLLCLPRRQARREAIVDLLWPDADPEQATQYIHTATTKLRKVLQRPAGPGSLLLSEDDALWYRL